MRPSRSFTLTELMIVVALISIAATFFAFSVRSKRRTHCGRTKCPNNLRQLGLAAIQYADDKRFFPHHNKMRTLDGDVDTDHATKIQRALLWYGYHDNPEGWICPSSDDAYVPIENAQVRQNMRLWFWKGKVASASGRISPFEDGARDPALGRTTELSYGWTRKGMNGSARSTRVLAADRAVRIGPNATSGNHEAGWNVLRVDATVDFITPGFDPDGTGARVGIGWLRGTGKNDGYLAIADQSL